MRKYIIAVCCMSVFCVANAAPSVRALGGAGTFDGASNAAGTTSGVARAGSIRAVTKSGTAASISKNASTSSAGRAASNPRLSIGKYLKHGTSVSGGGTIKSDTPSSGGDMTPGAAADINSRIDAVESRVTDVTTDISDIRSEIDGLRDTVDGDFATREYVDTSVASRVDTATTADQELGGTYTVTGTLNVPDQLLP